MKNVNVSVEGDTLILRVDLTENHGPSASGKTQIVASSEGNSKVPGHDSMRFGLNVFEKS